MSAEVLGELVAALGLLEPRRVWQLDGQGPVVRPVLHPVLMEAPPLGPYETPDDDPLASFVAHLPPEARATVAEQAARCLQALTVLEPGDPLFEHCVPEEDWRALAVGSLGLELAEPLCAPSGEVLLFFRFRHVHPDPRFPPAEQPFFVWLRPAPGGWQAFVPQACAEGGEGVPPWSEVRGA